MDKLFSDSETFQLHRPTHITDEQATAFYTKMAAEIIKNRYSSGDPEDIVEDLKRLCPFRENGYELAKELERSRSVMYDIDSSFCEWLDSLGYEYASIHNRNVKEWAAAHPQPHRFEKGSRLEVTGKLPNPFKTGDIVFIHDARDEDATYLVHKDPNYKGGYVVAYEMIDTNCTINV